MTNEIYVLEKMLQKANLQGVYELVESYQIVNSLRTLQEFINSKEEKE
jgi:hypothetical protein